VNNPLLMLDEVDKLGRDYRGDPSAALMEIIDPSQNAQFRDNYLDLPFDLSKVFFIMTANTLDNIPGPLLDRMEIMRLSGYSREEKAAIARKFLIPRRVNEAGLKADQFELPDETLGVVISRYTREAGVRELERSIGRLCRKIARKVAEGVAERVAVRPDDLSDLLGPERFLPEKARKQMPAGVATGLAWTEFGGDVLYVEAVTLPGERRMRLTGSLGRVMKESARAARSFIWSHADELGIDPRDIRRNGLHVHVPSGAVPKDGPSAGVALVSALASLYADKPLPSDLAMTGEITLSGLVLPVGGIKEKVLAAHRAGIKRIILPKDNAKDFREVPEHVRKEIEVFFAERVDDVLKVALSDNGKRKHQRGQQHAHVHHN
jgi:ATP-dependent Lon protease